MPSNALELSMMSPELPFPASGRAGGPQPNRTAGRRRGAGAPCGGGNEGSIHADAADAG